MRFLLVSILIIVIVKPGLAKDVWEKDWRTWGKNDCLKLLDNSPWSKIKPNANTFMLELAKGDREDYSGYYQVKASIVSPVVARAASRLIQLQNNLSFDQADSIYKELGKLTDGKMMVFVQLYNYDQQAEDESYIVPFSILIWGISTKLKQLVV